MSETLLCVLCGEATEVRTGPPMNVPAWGATIRRKGIEGNYCVNPKCSGYGDTVGVRTANRG